MQQSPADAQVIMEKVACKSTIRFRLGAPVHFQEDGGDFLISDVWSYSWGCSAYYITKKGTNIAKLMKEEEVQVRSCKSFLLLQEEVEEISLMKPKALLEFLEDIIETSIHAKNIDQSLKQLNATRSQMMIELAKIEKVEQKFDDYGGILSKYKTQLKKFMKDFNTISEPVSHMYKMMKHGVGGNAELKLVDSDDPFSQGVVFRVRRPGSGWKNIADLSGFEKTLSTVALVLAFRSYKPIPTYTARDVYHICKIPIMRHLRSTLNFIR